MQKGLEEQLGLYQKRIPIFTRSVKGQFTQASRSGAPTTVVVRADGAVVRHAGRGEQAVALGEVVATLKP